MTFKARPMTGPLSLWQAMLIAPLGLAPLGVLLLMLFSTRSVIDSLFLSAIALPVLGYLYEIVLILPLAFVMDRQDDPRPGAFALVGGLVGCMPALFLVLIQVNGCGILAAGSVTFGAMLSLILWMLAGRANMG